MKTPKVLGYTTAIFTTAISLSLTAPAAFAQESFKNWDPRWSVLSSGISRPQTNEERNALKEYFDISKISVNGKVVWQNGQARNNVSGVKFVSETSKYINFEIDPGTWEINAN